MQVLPSVPQTEGAKEGSTVGVHQVCATGRGELWALGEAKQQEG